MYLMQEEVEETMGQAVEFGVSVAKQDGQLSVCLGSRNTRGKGIVDLVVCFPVGTQPIACTGRLPLDS
jgi:hypothetical protein